MSLPVFIEKSQPYYFDDPYPNPVVVATGLGTLTRILSVRARTGLQPFITLYAQQIDAGGIATVVWHLYRNGNPMAPYHAHNNQTSAPQDNIKLPVPIRIEQDDLIEVYAEQGSGSSQNAIARVMIEYQAL